MKEINNEEENRNKDTKNNEKLIKKQNEFGN